MQGGHAPVAGKRRFALPRLQLRGGPAADGGLYLGPFRNSHLAETARKLARALFRLDESRRRDTAGVYRERLLNAWQFLNGDTECGLAEARRGLARATSERDYGASRRWRGLLDRARAYDPQQLILPADPRHTRYAVVRPHPEGVEGFVLDKGVLVAHGISDGSDPEAFAQGLAEDSRPRTDPTDVELVLRWLGAQHDPLGKEARFSARVLHLPDNAAGSTQVICDAATAVLAEQ